MNQRPRSITIIGWLFVAIGCIGLVRGSLPLMRAAARDPAGEIRPEPLLDVVLACGSSLLAGISGAFLLYGRNWLRWLCIVWLGLHVILSLFHDAFELVVHSLLFAAILYFLLRPQASAYFRGGSRSGPVNR